MAYPEPEGREDTPEVGTFYLWDGDQMVAEAPLHLGGYVAWEKAIWWHYGDEGSHTPIAKQLPPTPKHDDGELLHIVSDHLGTPKEMFDERGNLVWAADYHVWGKVRSVRTQGALALKPSHDVVPAEYHCPFRFPGQYEDAETGLYYNRHRHYDPLTAQYTSPDPIGLAGGDRPQGYVVNPNIWVDPMGLTQTVGRWMKREEYLKMKDTGRVQEGAGGQTFVSTSGLESFRKQAGKDTIYVEFKVPKNSLLKGGREDWKKLIGPNAGGSQQKMLQKQGGVQLPKIDGVPKIIEVQ